MLGGFFSCLEWHLDFASSSKGPSRVSWHTSKGRVMAGDQSLIEVINTNAVSEAPMQQAYRAAMEQSLVDPTLEEICNVKKKRERDDVDWELQVAERKMKLEEASINRQERMVDVANKAVQVMSSINGFENIDDRAKVQFEDLIKNTMFKPSVTLVTTTSNINDEKLQTVTVSNETASLNVTVKARQMHINLSDKEAINAGRLTATKYRAKYNAQPSQHKQFVKGAYIFVKSYMAHDSDMMEEVINKVVAKHASLAVKK